MFIEAPPFFKPQPPRVPGGNKQRAATAVGLFALHELEQIQQHHGAKEGADQVPQFARGAEAQQIEQKSAQQRAQHADNQIAENAKAAALDHQAGEKSRREADQREPKPVFHSVFVWGLRCDRDGN